MDFTENPLTTIAMNFELIITIIASIVLVLIYRRYLEKRNKIAFLLFCIFLFLDFSVFFSYLSKVLWFYYKANPALVETDPFMGLNGRIIDYRITYICSIIASYLTFNLQANIFDISVSKKQQFIFQIFGGVTIIIALGIYDINGSLWNTIVAILTMLYTVSIYVLFLIKAIALYRQLLMDNRVEKDAIKWLILMGVFFILIYICAVLSQVIYLFVNQAYNIAYFAMWSFSIAAIFSAYFGYLNPSHVKTAKNS